MLETLAAFVLVGALLLLAVTVALAVAFLKVLGALVLWPLTSLDGGIFAILAFLVLGTIGLVVLVAVAPLVLGFVVSVVAPLALLGAVLWVVARARTVPAPQHPAAPPGARPAPVAIPARSTVQPA